MNKLPFEIGDKVRFISKKKYLSQEKQVSYSSFGMLTLERFFDKIFMIQDICWCGECKKYHIDIRNPDTVTFFPEAFVKNDQLEFDFNE